jgi:hypothetical protein
MSSYSPPDWVCPRPGKIGCRPKVLAVHKDTGQPTVNAQEKLAGTSPAESQILDWIGQAKKLEPKITY